MTDRPAQLRRVGELAEKKDDPEAWAALANAYRIKGLKKPVEEAIRSVGWEKVRTLIIQHRRSASGQVWPDGLREFLDAERRKQLAKRDDGSRAATAWRRGEYGTEGD